MIFTWFIIYYHFLLTTIKKVKILIEMIPNIVRNWFWKESPFAYMTSKLAGPRGSWPNCQKCWQRLVTRFTLSQIVAPKKPTYFLLRHLRIVIRFCQFLEETFPKNYFLQCDISFVEGGPWKKLTPIWPLFSPIMFSSRWLEWAWEQRCPIYTRDELFGHGTSWDAEGACRTA